MNHPGMGGRVHPGAELYRTVAAVHLMYLGPECKVFYQDVSGRYRGATGGKQEAEVSPRAANLEHP